jgi:hypothetical protein
MTAPTVLMKDGRADIVLRYAEADVGAAEITAAVMDVATTYRMSDPLAATIEIPGIQADSQQTPALVQLVQDGKMLPGRYQESVPGIFVTPPWSIDVAPGRWQLSVNRGPEFRPYRRTLDVKSGQTVKVDEVKLERQVDPRVSGWYGGDADGDVYHGERIYTDVTPRTAAEISQAMGLDWAGVGSWGSPSPKTWREAREFTRGLSRPNFLFLWTDEKPKGGKGHACFVGLERPDEDAFGWGWTRMVKPLENFEALKLNRDSGAATFANHPVRWWTSGGKFRTNMYAALPFDLCACGFLDGYNINEKPNDVHVWSLLLDHGYRVAATTGADFGLDRPNGPVPGKSRMYCYCPNGLSGTALAEAVRRGNTIVSTGPVLMADIDGKPPGSMLSTGQTYSIRTKAWARADEPDLLRTIELWAHGKGITSKSFDANVAQAEHSFTWEPKGEWDWVAVRLVTKKGWAMTSAFYASGPKWQAPQQPVECQVTLAVTGLDSKAQQSSFVEIWDGLPGLATSKKVSEHPLAKAATFKAPVSSTVVVRTADGRQRVISLYHATGASQIVDRIASGEERDLPLLDWKTYENVLKRCESAKVEVAF